MRPPGSLMARARMRRLKHESRLFGFVLPITAISVLVASSTATGSTKKVTAESAKAVKAQQKLERMFRKNYHVDLASFQKLLDMVTPGLQYDARQASRRSKIVLTPAVMLQTCLRWLAGGRYQDICDIVGITVATFYRVLNKVLDAINKAVALQPHFPKEDKDLEAAAAGFQQISEGGNLAHCIGAIDGWLCPILVPGKNECGRVISFFSGHYQKYGLNVQACADHESRFTAFCVRAPGGMNDSLAFKQWNLSKVIADMPSPYYVVGDNAYTQRPYLMTPFNKAQVAGNIERDSYNFHVSQLRIRVEMAFGLLVSKWRVLKSPLAVALKRCPAVISACIRLHNFCVNERIRAREAAPTPTKKRRYQVSRVEDDIEFDRGELSDAFGDFVRERLVEHIAGRNQVRPARNLSRQAAESTVV